jgi:LacI family transcriptional regulator
LSPQLTTLVLPHREMGRWAVEHGFSLPTTRREKYPITKLECPLIERASIAGPKRATGPARALAGAGERL